MAYKTPRSAHLDPWKLILDPFEPHLEYLLWAREWRLQPRRRGAGKAGRGSKRGQATGHHDPIGLA